jgi:PAS domain S-box-containing protein
MPTFDESVAMEAKVSIRESGRFRSRARLAAESKAWQGSIADHLDDLVSVHAPDGTYLYASPAARDLLGYRPEDMIGSSAYEYIHPDDKGKVAAVHRSSLEGAPLTAAYRLRRKDNEYVWVETTTRVIAEEDSRELVEIVCSTRPLQDRSSVDRLVSDEHRHSVARVQAVLEGKQIRPVYQPIFDLENRRVVAYEALSRFPGDPAHGPDAWFAEAWDVGLGIPLELCAMRTAAKALTSMPSEVSLFVNASPETIFATPFVSCFGDNADRVTVEMTEHHQVDDYEGFTTRLRPLREAGGQVAIDDFGAGYASLRHILAIRPEWIKFDSSLTEGIGENPLAHALANSLVSFTEEVGVRVIAEGIETEDELEALREIGFRYGQGFYFGMPAPLDEVQGRAPIS